MYQQANLLETTTPAGRLKQVMEKLMGELPATKMLLPALRIWFPQLSLDEISDEEAVKYCQFVRGLVDYVEKGVYQAE